MPVNLCIKTQEAFSLCYHESVSLIQKNTWSEFACVIEEILGI